MELLQLAYSAICSQKSESISHHFSMYLSNVDFYLLKCLQSRRESARYRIYSGDYAYDVGLTRDIFRIGSPSKSTLSTEPV